MRGIVIGLGLSAVFWVSLIVAGMWGLKGLGAALVLFGGVWLVGAAIGSNRSIRRDFREMREREIVVRSRPRLYDGEQDF